MFVLYSCNICKANKQKVTVPERKPNEHIKDWMDKVTIKVAQNHGIFGCSNNKVDLMIPVLEEGKPLGTPKDR